MPGAERRDGRLKERKVNRLDTLNMRATLMFVLAGSLVGAIGFEFWGTRIFNNIESHGGHRKAAVEGSGKQC